jgi:hypothetical protein
MNRLRHGTPREVMDWLCAPWDVAQQREQVSPERSVLRSGEVVCEVFDQGVKRYVTVTFGVTRTQRMTHLVGLTLATLTLLVLDSTWTDAAEWLRQGIVTAQASQKPATCLRRGLTVKLWAAHGQFVLEVSVRRR